MDRELIQDAINHIISGDDVDEVVEDLARTSALYAADMMLFNKDSMGSASDKAKGMIGIEPADDTLHMAAVNMGTPKSTPTYSFVPKAGMYKPEKAVDTAVPQKKKLPKEAEL